MAGSCCGACVKTCNKCRERKPANAFASNRAAFDGLQARCKECSRIDNRLSYERNREKHKRHYRDNRDTIRMRQKKYRDANAEVYNRLARLHRRTIKGRARSLLNAVKSRCRTNGWEFDLCLARIEVALMMGRCERTGVAFILEQHDMYKNHPFAPSVDRRDPFRGYTHDNVQIVCAAYNIGKNQMTDDEYIAFCKIVAERCQ